MVFAQSILPGVIPMLYTRSKNLAAFAIAFLLTFACPRSFAEQIVSVEAAELHAVNAYTLSGGTHLHRHYPATDRSGNVHAVIEIPTGTNAKWEVDKDTGELIWEFKNGSPRVVSYLAYPGNYGMIPGTLLSKEEGGDGDPLDILVLGPAASRGSVLKTRVIGVLRMLDDGEQDDKLIAVPVAGSPLSSVSDLQALDQNFPGITKILEIWFSNYKGPGEIESLGYDSKEEAEAILADSVASFERSEDIRN